MRQTGFNTAASFHVLPPSVARARAKIKMGAVGAYRVARRQRVQDDTHAAQTPRRARACQLPLTCWALFLAASAAGPPTPLARSILRPTANMYTSTNTPSTTRPHEAPAKGCSKIKLFQSENLCFLVPRPNLGNFWDNPLKELHGASTTSPGLTTGLVSHPNASSPLCALRSLRRETWGAGEKKNAGQLAAEVCRGLKQQCGRTSLDGAG
ncbi:hypothetical protein B0H13DRAFT_1864240 [Mycena leptocephala]|nr:hypothetical protein B0H13DRAFT_1864240 [Mycena leptocephala]